MEGEDGEEVEMGWDTLLHFPTQPAMIPLQGNLLLLALHQKSDHFSVIVGRAVFRRVEEAEEKGILAFFVVANNCGKQKLKKKNHF